MITPIVKYINGGGTDHAGRTLTDVLKFDDALLEHTHDYIQWMFPLNEGSAFNKDAPILTDEDIKLIKEDIRLYEEGFEKMMDFYGFRCAYYGGGPTVLPAFNNFKEKLEKWVTPNNHNFLRITRILKSLCLLGFHEYAEEFLHSLKIYVFADYREIVGEVTMQFWNAAVVDPNEIKMWTIMFFYNYDKVIYKQYYFYGPRWWAQEQANKIYKTLPEWMTNRNMTINQEYVESMKDFKVIPYEPKEWEGPPVVQIYSK